MPAATQTMYSGLRSVCPTPAASAPPAAPALAAPAFSTPPSSAFASASARATATAAASVPVASLVRGGGAAAALSTAPAACGRRSGLRGPAGRPASSRRGVRLRRSAGSWRPGHTDQRGVDCSRRSVVRAQAEPRRDCRRKGGRRCARSHAGQVQRVVGAEPVGCCKRNAAAGGGSRVGGDFCPNAASGRAFAHALGIPVSQDLAWAAGGGGANEAEDGIGSLVLPGAQRRAGCRHGNVRAPP
mmetsp:Transcript_4733/g.20243  ORF Transcript_4733/g.20243 Transcript_4733/m.20243 type:complete len:243 (+) Transcript_4733:75-803(+)